ncbi:hypothetical protein Pmani_015185 [Petrolisthes manimaculis]|uniref:Uncharacterized protein n=1 Tax=Petrolisthes manimaculis TaxID=1843537 RepID=A0AAE1PRE8_9EUCA|nr:hypothetical protein Pmani_023750 [Petrolisthes manimaculis]KAK4307272.1 hypothetical protein Pmani_020934 [Petrolisthes manimaculis]KAK4309851.1 hypothetical protein Pmani_018537 [Petrolisthes manimaculis]KAK4313471.1 hypothetical protein Pmani_015185 [Petrolisthes manimaculis]
MVRSELPTCRRTIRSTELRGGDGNTLTHVIWQQCFSVYIPSPVDFHRNFPLIYHMFTYCYRYGLLSVL